MRVSSVLIAAALLLPLPAAAQQTPAPQQEVQGIVSDGSSLAPVEGAMILLFDEGGRRVGGVLSAVNGRYRMPVLTPGRYRLRVDRIGYGSTDTDVFDVPAGTSVRRDVVTAVRPVELAGIEVEGRNRCDVRPAEGLATATVWEEVRKALDAAALTADRETYSFTWTRFSRELDENARRVLSERRTTERGYTSSPFAADDPADLATRGFVETLPGGDLQYSAPDARVLLSNEFLDTHCFRIAERDEAGGRIGLAFQPLLDRPVPDIEGVLWIDRASAILESLEFRYTNLFPGLDQHSAGGDLSFEHLPNGTWIVKEWNLRMPVVQETRTGRQLGNLRNLYVAGYRAEGGVVLRATTNTGQVVMDNAAGGIRGVLVDSIGDPLPGELVRIAGTSTETQTGVDGTFSFTGVGNGSWTVVAEPYAFTQVGLELDGVPVVVSGTGMSDVRLQTPALGDALGSACAEPLGPDEAVVAGRVLDRNGRIVPGAQVRLGWQNVLGIGGGVATQQASTTDLAGANAGFLFCGIPSAGTVAALASFDGRVSEQRPVAFSGRTGTVTLILPEAPTPVIAQTVGAGDGGSLRFHVTDADTGEPIDGALVGFPELELYALSDGNGEAVLPRVPPGEHRLEVTMLGYGDATATIAFEGGTAATGSVALTSTPIAIEGITATVGSTLAAAPVSSANRITEDELKLPAISRMNVVEAVLRLRPNWMRSRGETSFRPNLTFGGSGVPPSCGPIGGVARTSCSAFDITPGRNPPGVIVDGIPQPFETMEAMSPAEVLDMEFLSAADATIRFGTGYPNGAILITTVGGAGR